MTLCVSSYENQKKFLLEAKNGKLEIGELENGEENWWIKTNVHQAGFYRVKYDENLEARLWKALSSDRLSASDEFGQLRLFLIISCYLILKFFRAGNFY